MIEINGIKVNLRTDFEKLPNKKEFEINILNFLKEWTNNSTVVKTKTSGSTGEPKTITLSKSSMIESARLTNQFFKLSKGDCALLCLPTNFIAGKMMLVRGIVGKLRIESIEPCLNPLKNHTTLIDFAAMTPMQVKTILKETPSKLNLIDKLIIGGAPVDKQLEESLKPFSTVCYSTFGMTETITHIAVKKLNKNNEFKALPSIQFRQANDGCLIIEAPHLKNKEIKTNDVVELTSNTSFIWKGRIDNVINTGRIKIQPEEIESQLLEVIPNNRFFVTSEKDELLGEKIILIIEAKEKIDLSIQNFNHLSKYSIPKKIYYMSEFIESENGKILKQKTKEATLNL